MAHGASSAHILFGQNLVHPAPVTSRGDAFFWQEADGARVPPDCAPAKCPCALSADGLAWPSHSIRSLDGTVKLVAMSDKLAPLYWCCVTPALRRDAGRREILLSVERASPDPLSPRRDHTELGSGQRISPIIRQGPLDHQDDHVSKHSSRCQSSMLRQHDDDAHKFAKWLYHLATWLEGAEPPSASSCALHPRLARS